MAEGHEEIERRIKRSRATDGGLEGAAADQDLAKHFKVAGIITPLILHFPLAPLVS